MDREDRPIRERPPTKLRRAVQPKAKGRDVKLFLGAVLSTIILVILLNALRDVMWAFGLVVGIGILIFYLVYRSRKNRRAQS